MTPQPTHIMDRAWDWLIILDACRYDMFERIGAEFLDTGSLEMIASVGTCTSEWRDKTFTGAYPDLVYVSANPYIGSRPCIDGFDGGRRFFKVVDVWRDGWDHERGTVRPETVNEWALRAIATYPGKRFIIHYLQPHAPYLSLDRRFQGFPEPRPGQHRPISGLSGLRADRPWQTKLFNRLLPWAKRTRLLGEPATWRLRQLLGMAPQSPMDAVRRALGRPGLRRAYEDNLRCVLTAVMGLLPYLEGTVVVTSDHGERLGEGRRFTHGPDLDDPLLRQVPWLTVSCTRRQPLPQVPRLEEAASPQHEQQVDEQMRVEERLRALGYME